MAITQNISFDEKIALHSKFKELKRERRLSEQINRLMHNFLNETENVGNKTQDVLEKEVNEMEMKLVVAKSKLDDLKVQQQKEEEEKKKEAEKWTIHKQRPLF